MSRSSAISRSGAKAWFAKEIGFLEIECAQSAPGRTSQLPPNTSGDALPDLFYNIAAIFFENYQQRAFAHVRSNPSSAWSFLLAHAKLCEEYDFGDPQDMARNMNGIRLRAKQLALGIGISPSLHAKQSLPPAVSLPSSGSSTPCSIDVWRDNVAAADSECPSQYNEPPYEDRTWEVMEAGSRGFASPIKLAEPSDRTSKSADRIASAPSKQQPRRAQYHRAAKVARFESELPALARKRTSTRTEMDTNPSSAAAKSRACDITVNQIAENKKQRHLNEARENKRRKLDLEDHT